MTALCNQVFVLTLYLPMVCFSFNTTAGTHKNWVCVHLQRQQSKLVLTCISHCKGYTLIYLVHFFLKNNSFMKEIIKNNNAIDY